jgi:signal peptidase
MRPVLHSGDIVVYRRGAQGVAVGDLVVFSHPEWSGGVVHRVIAIARDGSLVTRGDANAAQDFEPVSRDRVVGIAVVLVPSGKAVALARQAAE